jgi:hypothetical protein
VSGAGVSAGSGDVGDGAGCAAGAAAAGAGPTTIVGRRVAEASVVPACGPAAAPAATPKASISSVATPATRREGSGQAVAGRPGPGAGGAAVACVPVGACSRACASGSSRGGPRRSPQLRQ